MQACHPTRSHQASKHRAEGVLAVEQRDALPAATTCDECGPNARKSQAGSLHVLEERNQSVRLLAVCSKHKVVRRNGSVQHAAHFHAQFDAVRRNVSYLAHENEPGDISTSTSSSRDPRSRARGRALDKVGQLRVAGGGRNVRRVQRGGR